MEKVGLNITPKEFSEKDSFIIRIHLPKGTKGAFLGASEYLLPRNSKLKLKNFNKDLKIADVEYILPLVSEVNKLNSSKFIKYGSVIAVAALFVFEVLLELKVIKDPARKLYEAPLPLRWVILFAGIFIILTFGFYGPGYDPAPFIYFQF